MFGKRKETTALTISAVAALPTQDSVASKDGPLFVATAAREKKLKDDLNRRSLKEEALGRQLKPTTQDMRAYDFINELVHSGDYQTGQIVSSGEICLELFGRIKSGAEWQRHLKATKNMLSAICGAFNERQFGRLTLLPATDPQGRTLGVRVPATVEERDIYLNKIGHAKAIANGKVVRTEEAFMALPSSNPVRLLNSTTSGAVVVERELGNKILTKRGGL